MSWCADWFRRDFDQVYMPKPKENPNLSEGCARFIWMDWLKDLKRVGTTSFARSIAGRRFVIYRPDACIPGSWTVFTRGLRPRERFGNYLQTANELPSDEKLRVGSRLMLPSPMTCPYRRGHLCGDAAGVCPDESWVWARLVELYFETILIPAYRSRSCFLSRGR